MRNKVFASLGILALPVAFASCDGGSPTEPTPPAQCTYTLSASSLNFEASGGSNAVNVTTSASTCTWNATSDRGWMSITGGSSGTGNGTVSVSLTANTRSETRSGTLTVAGQAVAVQQEGLAPCTITIDPVSAGVGKDASVGSFGVAALAHCEWTATSGAAWLAITSGGQGAGNGTVAYAVERNRDSAGRTAVITVADKTFTLAQAGDPGEERVCDYSVSPITFAPCMSVPYDLVADVTAPVGCTWTVDPDASWITLTSGRSGSGSGTIRFRVSDNYDAPRQSVLKVRWPTPTAGQNLQVQQAGCRYGVTATNIDIAAAGGTGRFDVLQQSDPVTCGSATQDRCVWTAVSNASWITVTTSMPQIGDNSVSFTVAANSATSARSGSITVRDKVVRVTQPGR